MVLKFRVTLKGIKGFFRLYYLNADTTLYTFHKQMRADLEFPQDQLIMFKGLDAEDNVVGRYGLFDLGSGTVDAVTVGECCRKGVASFVYFYDVTNRKSVIITCEGEAEGKTVPAAYPLLVEVKGPVPLEFENGYVAYEDLPDEQRHLPGERSRDIFGFGDDDEDFDEDEEEDTDEPEDDDEDGKEIFDENDGNI